MRITNKIYIQTPKYSSLEPKSDENVMSPNFAVNSHNNDDDPPEIVVSPPDEEKTRGGRNQ